MSKALELAKFGRESAPTGLVVGDSDAQTLSQKTFSDMPTFSSGTANGVAYLNGSKVLTTASGLVFDGTNLGVGTSSPAAKLHVSVAGDNETVIARFGTTSTGSVTSQLKVLSDPSTNTVKFDATGSSSQNYSFMSGGTERFKITSAGSVAIGTNDASNGKFTVNAGTAGTGYSAFFSNVDGTYNPYLRIFHNGINGIKIITSSSYGGTAGNLTFAPNATDAVTINTSGNVGIGTVNPQSTLDVYNGTANSKVAYIASLGSYVADQGPTLVLRNGTNGGEELAGIKGAFSQSSQGNYGYLALLTRTSDALGITEKMRITSAGGVIIGDTAIQYSSKLYVNGAIAARHGGVDGTYQPAFIAGYTSNYTEANVISTAVSSDGNGSGFRFEVSDGAGSAGRTSTVWFKRASAYFNTPVGINGQLSIGGNSLYFEKSGTRSWQLYASQSTGQAWLASGDGVGNFTIACDKVAIGTSNPSNKFEVIAAGGGLDTAVSLQTHIGRGITITSDNSGQNSRVGLIFRGSDQIGAAIASAREDAGTTWKTYMSFYTNNQTGSNVLSLQEKMRLDSDGNLNILTKTDNGVNSQAFPGALKFTGTGWNTTVGTLPTGAQISLAGNYNDLNGGSTEPSLVFSLYGTGSGDYNNTAGPTTLTERMRINNYGKVTVTGNIVSTLGGPIYETIDCLNINPAGTGFDYIGNNSDGGGTYWQVVGSRVVDLYSTSGGHSGSWGYPVRIDTPGYYRLKLVARLSSTNGGIHGNTAASNYKYSILVGFVLNTFSVAGKWDVDALGNGTRVCALGTPAYCSAGTYQMSYSTNGYEGVKQIYLYELVVERVG